MEEPLACAVVFVVPELPFGTRIPKCKWTYIAPRSNRYTLIDNSVLRVFKRCPGWTDVLYPNSESGWFCKITEKITPLALESGLNFLKLFKFDFEIARPQCPLNILKKLKEGLRCEDFRSLQEALTFALALKYWEHDMYQDRLGAGSTNLIDTATMHEKSYADIRPTVEAIYRNIRKKME